MQGVPSSSCIPSRLSQEGITAHLYYEENEKKLDLQCISCHLDVGHYDPNYTHAKMQGMPQQPEAKKGEPYHRSRLTVTAFENFTETIPGTTVSFDMKAIPGGTFAMGSPGRRTVPQGRRRPRKKSDRFAVLYRRNRSDLGSCTGLFTPRPCRKARTPPEKVVYANNSESGSRRRSAVPTPPFGIARPGLGQRQPAGHHDDPLRGRNVLPVAVEENRQEIPSAYRSRMGIRRRAAERKRPTSSPAIRRNSPIRASGGNSSMPTRPT